MGQLAPRESSVVTFNQVAKYFAEPILQVPRDWQPHVMNFQFCYASILKDDGMLSLCSRMRVWAEQGIVLEDILPAFVRLTHPAVMGRYKFSSDLLADLGVWVNDAAQSRRQREELARSKNQGTIAKGETQKVREMLSELFSNPNSFINRTDDDEIPSPPPPPKSEGKTVAKKK